MLVVNYITNVHKVRTATITEMDGVVTKMEIIRFFKD